MSVKVRPYRKGGWEVDLRVILPDGTEHRQRRKCPLGSKLAAQRWGEERERVWSDATGGEPHRGHAKLVGQLNGG